jgi:hypothetical protein
MPPLLPGVMPFTVTDWLVTSTLTDSVADTDIKNDVKTKMLSVARITLSNDPSSATRPKGHFDCARSAMAGFAAAHG